MSVHSRNLLYEISGILQGETDIPFRLFIKPCENIGMFIKNYKSTIPGSNEVVYGPFEQESEKKNQNLDFSICKIVLL